MEKNCQAYIKIEKVGNTIVFHRCLNDVNNTTICKDHLLSQSLKENYDKKGQHLTNLMEVKVWK